MSVPAIRSLSFLLPGSFPDDDPYAGLEDTLQLFQFGERLEVDGAWIRQRHLEHGVSAAPVFLAAASQRTRHIELGTAVIPIGYESPFRLAEDLSTADVLSRGRLQVGLSAGPPPTACSSGAADAAPGCGPSPRSTRSISTACAARSNSPRCG